MIIISLEFLKNFSGQDNAAYESVLCYANETDVDSMKILGKGYSNDRMIDATYIKGNGNHKNSTIWSVGLV